MDLFKCIIYNWRNIKDVPSSEPHSKKIIELNYYSKLSKKCRRSIYSKFVFVGVNCEEEIKKKKQKKKYKGNGRKYLLGEGGLVSHPMI